MECSLHHFSDASQEDYGQATQLHLIDEKGVNHCTLVWQNLMLHRLSMSPSQD